MADYFSTKKAFDIGDPPDDIDLDAPPVTGFDYLYRVRLETRNCPKVVVSNIDTSQFLCHQTVKVDFGNGFIRATPGFEPNSKWQENQLNTFSRYRDELLTNREALKMKFAKREYPGLRKKEWCLYSLGWEKFEEIYDKDWAKCKTFAFSDKGNPPLLSVILYLNQSEITTLLSYHIDWLQKIKFTHFQGEWIYALLSRLEKPLDPDTCSLLRNLSRVCSILRSELSSPEDEALKPLNIIITIISNCFDQKDMNDDFLNEDCVF